MHESYLAKAEVHQNVTVVLRRDWTDSKWRPIGQVQNGGTINVLRNLHTTSTRLPQHEAAKVHERLLTKVEVYEKVR